MHTLTSPLPHHVLLVLDYPCGMCDMHIAHNASCCSICTLPSSSFLANYQICFYFIAIPAQIISGQLLHVTTLAHYSISLPRQFSPWPGDLSGLGVVPVNKITRYIVTIFTFYLHWSRFPNDWQAFRSREFSVKKGKDCWEEVEKKSLRAKGWWELLMGDLNGWPEASAFLSQKLLRLQEFGFLVPKSPSTPRIWVSCLENSENGCTLPNSKQRLFFGHVQNCKKQNFKKPCTLQGFVEISYYQNCWNFEGCCCTLTTKFELIIAVRPLCSSFLLSSAGSFVWTEKVEVI